MTRTFFVTSLVLLMSHHNALAAGKEVLADHAMVATSHKKAVAVGIDILRQGGNAVDAAIAMNAVMGVVEPMSNGVGGDLYAIVWDAKSQKMYGLNASGRSPYAATIDYFEKHNLKEIPKSGPLSWSVPGAADGWDQLRMKFGTMPFSELLAPAIQCAEQGVEVPETIGGFWHLAEPTLRRHADAAKTFLVNGKAPRVGDVFVNKYIAKTLRTIAQGGRDAYYKGRIAKEIVDFSNTNGGLFSLRDFEDTASTWVEPVSTTYRGKRVWEIPPPGQGISVLQMLNLIEPFDLRAMGPGSADWLQLFIETKRLTYADRAKYYTDPAFAKVPVSQLISKDYAQTRHGLIDLKHAAPHVPPGEVALGGDTIYLCVVDKDRNCVSLIQSNYNGFGSGLVPGDLGFALQNRGTLFALDRNHANRLEPHRRPFHTIIPAMVTQNDKPWFVFGVMGGDMQPQGHVQVLVNLIDFQMDAQAAGDQPRVEHVGSATPTGIAEKGVGTVEAEPGIDKAVVEELKQRGQNVVTVKKNGGGYQGILIDPQTNQLHGASESRRDGEAKGY